jgi:hypothetical protein
MHWRQEVHRTISNSKQTVNAYKPCRGNEADKIREFKTALGLADEDAAPAHIDVGRRIMRSRFEASTRSGNSEQFRALQKLIYVSDLVFGVQKVRPSAMTNLNTHFSHPGKYLASACNGGCLRYMGEFKLPEVLFICDGKLPL